jgi:hypothetical protein
MTFPLKMKPALAAFMSPAALHILTSLNPPLLAAVIFS